MPLIRKLLLSLVCCCALKCGAQVPQWAIGIGSAENDDARVCAVAPNGNVYLAGFFSGTMDLDPSPATYNVTSKGNTDIFLACYTASGNFVWGLSVGDTSSDGALNLAVDKDNNAIIVGFFSGQHVNFDPLSPGPGKYLNDQGVIGGPLATGGDGFAAKYNSSGACTWAIDLGGSSVFDITEGVATDENGNVYVGGDFHYIMDIDPGPGVTNLNALNGTGYLIKYTPAGQLVWGFSFGAAGNNGVDNAVWNIRAKGGYIYNSGTFMNSGDFDPSPAAAMLTAIGGYDGYLAKYDTSGNYVFAVQVGGTQNESVYNLALDSSNIYITGSTTSTSMAFNGGGPSNSSTPGGGTNSDMFLAKYTQNGNYVWSSLTGGPKDESGLGIAINNNLLFATGYFDDTVDFDPSPATADLISKGENDIYLCKYDLNGNYICGFGAGGSANDQGRSLAFDAQGYMYVCGQFNGIKTNFSPTPTPTFLSTHGAGDGYIVKYDWHSLPTAPQGYIVGDTVCAGAPAYLTFTATSGTAPYTIVYTNGQVSDTVKNVQNGQQFALSPIPTTTTEYKLVLILSSGNCDPPGYVDTSATVLVNPLPLITTNNDTTVCPGVQLTLYVTPGYSYYWYGTGIDSPTIADPHIAPQSSGTYIVVATDTKGCATAAHVNVNIYPAKFSTDALSLEACAGDTARLQASGADSYFWYPDTDSSLSSDTVANPLAWPKQNTVYYVAMEEKKCGRRDTLKIPVVLHTLPTVKITEAHDVDCGSKAGQLVVTGARYYQWSPATHISDVVSANPTVDPPVNTMYYVTGYSDNGCSSTDSAYIQVFYDGTGRLFAPTAFTPNGDGKNDCFQVHVPGNVSDYQLQIFNRWGQLVYNTLSYGDCWDGIFNGVPQEMGTYFYSYSCTSSSCGALKGKGDVQLIR